MESNELEVLRGTRLNAIVFVLDYLQIQFETGLATFLEYPNVTLRENTYAFGDDGYRNVLCEFISDIVSSVDYKQDTSFCLNFEKGKIHISLAPERYNLPEMVVIDIAGKSIVF